MAGKSRAAGFSAAWAAMLFAITLIIRLMAGDGEMLATEMLENAPPERTGLPAEEYYGVGRMTAGYLTGAEERFQYWISDENDRRIACFQAHEQAHMADCRKLIRLDGVLCGISLAAAIGLSTAGMRRREGWTAFLKGVLRGIMAAGILAAGLAIWAAADFDGFFTTFHRVAFTNDGWLLNPRTDLLIRLMPTAFFIRLGIRGVLWFTAVPAGLAAAAGMGIRAIRKKDGQ